MLETRPPINSLRSVRYPVVLTKNSIYVFRYPQTELRLGLSRSTIYAKIFTITFPNSVRLGVRAVGWIDSEIDSWLVAQVHRSPMKEYEEEAHND